MKKSRLSALLKELRKANDLWQFCTTGDEVDQIISDIEKEVNTPKPKKK
jgi:hypothetical protein